MSLIAELKRRNVIRMTGLYLVGAWLVIQVSSTVLPMFDAPTWLPRSIVVILAVGFIPALIFSWVFELTPDGIKRDAEVNPEESIAPQTARRMDRTIIVVLVVALAYFGFDKFVLTPRREEAQIALAAKSAVQQAAQAINNKSIAVLPFENLSDDKANAYFADGMQDEILTRLSKISTLRVISRTSTLQFASHPENLPEIAKKLGVATILEGSVQKSGNKVRINVQLIRAMGDQHLWAETYDRTLDDVFGVQGEVAGTIADKLGATLSGDTRQQVNQIATRNAAAADAYLRGLALLHKGYMTTQFKASMQAFEDAVHADPGFAAAWALLARGDSQMVLLGLDSSPERRAATLHALETAERLQPDTLETLSARAYYIYRVQGDLDEARKRFEALNARWPNTIDVLMPLSYVLERQDHWAEADALIAQALQLDPLNVQLHKLRAGNATGERRFDEAVAELHSVQALAPGDAESRRMEAAVWLARGDLTHAAQLLDKWPTLASEESEQPQFVALARLQRSYPDAIASLERVLKNPDPNASGLDMIAARLDLAELQRLAGDPAAAGNYRTARDAVQDLLKKQPGNVRLLGDLAFAEAGLGNEKAAFAAIDAVLQQTPESKDVNFARIFLDARASLLARFGQKDEAIAGLRHLLSVPYITSVSPITPAILRLDPDFDTLRSDPEFQKLMQDPPAAKPVP